MAQTQRNSGALAAACMLFLGLVIMQQMVSAERLLKDKNPDQVFGDQKEIRPGLLLTAVRFFWQGGESSYEPVWPVSFSLV